MKYPAEKIHQIDNHARSVLISVNPKAGRSSPMTRARALKQELEQRQFDVELLTDLNEVQEKGQRLFAEQKLRALVGVGGDGTAAELVNRTAIGTPVTLLPAGTANLIAKYFKFPKKPSQWAAMIDQGQTLTMDAGRANDRLFLVMVSAGIDADIVRQVHQAREENFLRQTRQGAHISYFSYLKPIVASLKSYRFPQITVETLDEFSSGEGVLPDVTCPIEDSCQANASCPVDAAVRPVTRTRQSKWAFVFNMPRYGWGVPLVPRSDVTDALFDLCLFGRGGIVSSLANVFMAQLGGGHRILPNTTLLAARHVRLTSNADAEKNPLRRKPRKNLDDQKIPYQLDGDPGGFLPVDIEMIPNRVTLLVPKRTCRIQS